ncbi:MAG: electron transfer flavoprotein subunit alpha/FixB family protein [Bradymonadaceae bacterium]
MSDVLVVAEIQAGEIRKATYSVLTFGREAAEATGGDLHLLVLSDDPEPYADELAAYGADRVWTVAHEDLESYVAETYAPVVAEVAAEIDAEIVAAASSAQGSDYLPRVAQQLEAGMVTNAMDVWQEEGELKFKRPMWSSSIFKTLRVETSPKVASVRTTDFDDASAGDDAAPVEAFDVEVATPESVDHLGLELVQSERPELTDADVVISGGRGLESAEAFDMLEELADLFGGAVGASRAAVDSGYAPSDWQIGQTGKVVAPQLYVAIAISGAIQHLSGMKGSKYIVAINTDPEAPIFDVADYGLVEDAFQAVPELNDKLRQKGLGD